MKQKHLRLVGTREADGGGGSVVGLGEMSVAFVLEGGNVELTVGFQTRRELIRQAAPRYQKASISQKGALLDEIATTTGYARRYAMWLLNHPEEMQFPPHRQRQQTFGPEIQQALFFVWQHANQICTKRLMPYLATHLEALERHGHLHLTDSCRSQLLSMSAATADRLLRGPRTHGQRGLATTRAGTLLKQQISIRTFEQWNETQPGFLEADLVAHCASSLDGSYLYTLTLTDIATGWTECFPLRSKSAEAVVLALQQARTCFPFPILGLDTDNGSEFINERLLAYCDTEQITFTRGREGIKNDQSFVEQKNGAVVRQVVGYARFEGEHAYRQLGEIYQALRLYVNGFQPSMKLQAKQYDGRKVRRIYDAAKTPLQRLLLFTRAASYQGTRVAAGGSGAGPAAALSPPARAATGVPGRHDQRIFQEEKRDLFRNVDSSRFASSDVSAQLVLLLLKRKRKTAKTAHFTPLFPILLHRSSEHDTNASTSSLHQEEAGPLTW